MSLEMWSGSSTSGQCGGYDRHRQTSAGRRDKRQLRCLDLSVTVGGIEKYQGFAHIEKAGTSTWTLTNTSSYAGDINITQGSLRVDGTLNSVTQTTVANNTTLFGAQAALVASFKSTRAVASPPAMEARRACR